MIAALTNAITRLTPDRKVRMHRAPLGKLLGQHAPLAAAPEQVQHCAEHLVQVYSPRAGLLARALQQRSDGFELARLMSLG